MQAASLSSGPSSRLEQAGDFTRITTCPWCVCYASAYLNEQVETATRLCVRWCQYHLTARRRCWEATASRMLRPWCSFPTLRTQWFQDKAFFPPKRMRYSQNDVGLGERDPGSRGGSEGVANLDDPDSENHQRESFSRCLASHVPGAPAGVSRAQVGRTVTPWRDTMEAGRLICANIPPAGPQGMMVEMDSPSIPP